MPHALLRIRPCPSVLVLALCTALFSAPDPRSPTPDPPSGIVCDADSDCYYMPPGLASGETRPALLILSCTGAIPRDIDSNLVISDSLGWILASCHGSRNHRTGSDNDRDVTHTLAKLLRDYPVDSRQIFICGFSGMGDQALEELITHPDIIHGAVSSCAPLRPFPSLGSEALSGHAVYLITREGDWNLDGNHQWKKYFEDQGAATNLIVTTGQHEPGGTAELLTGCHWVYDNSE